MSAVDFIQLSLIIDLIRELDYEPRVDVFLECSPEQYEALAQQDYDTSTKWFVISRLAADPTSDPRTEVRLVSKPERDLIVDAALGIQDETDASGETFSRFQERVEHVSNKDAAARVRARRPAPAPTRGGHRARAYVGPERRSVGSRPPGVSLTLARCHARSRRPSARPSP